MSLVAIVVVVAGVRVGCWQSKLKSKDIVTKNILLSSEEYSFLPFLFFHFFLFSLIFFVYFSDTVKKHLVFCALGISRVDL